MKKSKKGQMAVVFLLLFAAALLFYAVMIPELMSIIDNVKAAQTDETIILIYDVLPFGIGFMLIIGLLASIMAVTR